MQNVGWESCFECSLIYNSFLGIKRQVKQKGKERGRGVLRLPPPPVPNKHDFPGGRARSKYMPSRRSGPGRTQREMYNAGDGNMCGSEAQGHQQQEAIIELIGEKLRNVR